MSHKSDKKEEWSKVESNSDMIWYHSLRKSKNGLFLLKSKDSITGGIFSNIFKRVLPMPGPLAVVCNYFIFLRGVSTS